METAFAWIGQIASWIGQWIPRWQILDTTEGAIKYVKGKPRECGSGQVHWYWPVTTTWVVYPVARQTDRLETQTMETTDRVTFIVAGTITYSVHDIMALVSTTHSPSVEQVKPLPQVRPPSGVPHRNSASKSAISCATAGS